MSIITEDLETITSPEETLEGFLAKNDRPRIGFEQEGHLIDAETKGGITPDQFYALEARGAEISVEAAANEFEVRSEDVLTLDNTATEAAEELNTKMQVVGAHAAEIGQELIPYSILPYDDFRALAATNIHKGPNPRPTSFIDFFMKNDPARARNFITVAGIQSSATFETPEDTLRYFNRMAHLSPLLSTMMSHVPPYAVLDEGRFGAVRTNLSLDRRLQTAGGADKAFPSLAIVDKINTANSETFMRAWNDVVWDTPIFSYYDPADRDEFTRLKHFEPAGEMVAFRDLPTHLQTRENFNMASSIQYGLLTQSALPADQNGLIKRRTEARLFDTGPGNANGVAGLGFALLGDDNFGEAVDRFIARAGFTPDSPSTSLPKLTRTLNANAKLDFNSLADLPYGDLSLAQAALDFHARVIEPFLDAHPELVTLNDHCREGTTPALSYRQHDSEEIIRTAHEKHRITNSNASRFLNGPNVF